MRREEGMRKSVRVDDVVGPGGGRSAAAARFFVAGPPQNKEEEGDGIGVDRSWEVSTSGEGAILIFFAYLIAE